MNYLRKKDETCYKLASMQARIFEKSAYENIPSYFFIQQFMNSFEAQTIDDSSILISGLSELEIYLNIKKETKRKKGNVYPLGVMHWIGFFYRYASYLTGIDSKKLFKNINPKKLYDLYPSYHALDIEKAVGMVLENTNISSEKPMNRFLNLYKNHKIVL